MNDMLDEINQMFNNSIQVIQQSSSLSSEILDAVLLIVQSIKKGNKLLVFGNGGSAADAQHISAELIGRFKLERKSFPAIALTTDSSILTCLLYTSDAADE